MERTCSQKGKVLLIKILPITAYYDKSSYGVRCQNKEKVNFMKWKYVKRCVISMLNGDYTIDNKIDYIISILSIYRDRRYGKRR